MPQHEIVGRDLSSGQPTRLLWREDKILAIEPAADAPKDIWIAPPLLDLQTNGFAGVDFQQDNLTGKELLHAVQGLREAGCTRFLLTLITDQWPAMLARLQHLRKLRSEHEQLRRAIVGWHVEGPFLSAEPGFCGAHDPALMIDPKPERMDELRKTCGNDPLLVTISPERLDAIATITHAISLGMKVSLGHTNAARKRLVQALQAGATGFTHLGNGCPKQLDRHDNVLWRVFEAPGFTVNLIPDMIHVSPALFRLTHRIIGAESIYYTTDAMAAAGAPPGRYKLGALELEVGEDQIVRLPGTANFAGSALTPIDGVFRAAEMLNCEWRQTWRNFSEIPARLMGFESGLRVGGPGDFCVIEVTPPNQLRSLKVSVGGELG